jgi:hypothetical protein
MSARSDRLDFEVERAKAKAKPIDQSSPRLELLAVRNEHNVERPLVPERQPFEQRRHGQPMDPVHVAEPRHHPLALAVPKPQRCLTLADTDRDGDCSRVHRRSALCSRRPSSRNGDPSRRDEHDNRPDGRGDRRGPPRFAGDAGWPRGMTRAAPGPRRSRSNRSACEGRECR